MSKKRYTEEFKIETVKKVVDQGVRIIELASCLGSTTHSLYTRKNMYWPGSS